MRKEGPPVRTLLKYVLAGMIFAFLAPFLEFTGQTMEPVPAAEPVYETTATWGDFDEIRLFRYYRLEDVPDIKSVPKTDTEYHGTAYAYISTDGPITIEFGECWEAMYREEEQK